MAQSILQKLQWKDQTPLLVLNHPAEMATVLATFPSTVEILKRVPRRRTLSFVLAFARTEDEVRSTLTQIAAALTDEAVLWFAYPKRSSKRYTATISRDQGWGPLGEAGYEAVRLIALDNDWSALRFRKTKLIPKLTRDPTRMLSRQ